MRHGTVRMTDAASDRLSVPTGMLRPGGNAPPPGDGGTNRPPPTSQRATRTGDALPGFSAPWHAGSMEMNRV